MSDLNHHDEEEYHFDDSENFDFGEHDAAAEEEFVGDEEVVEDTEAKVWNNERPGAVSSKKPLPTKKILIGVGVVVLLIAGYYLMVPHGKAPTMTTIPTAAAPKDIAKAKPAAAPVSAASSNGAPMAQQNAAMPQQNATTTQQQNPAMGSDANTTPDNTANGDWLSGDNTAPTSSNTQTTTTTATTSETTPATQPNTPDESNLPIQVETLNQENQTLALKLQQVTAQSEATAARAKSLEKVVAQLQAQVKQMTQTSPPPLKRPEAASMAAEPLSAMPRSSAESNTRLVYYVQAIIPGRAWIADSNGRIITVTQGDRVEALNSTVKNIDPINGIVTLSNGRQIEYGMVAQ